MRAAYVYVNLWACVYNSLILFDHHHHHHHHHQHHNMSGGQNNLLLALGMAKVGGPLSVVKVFNGLNTYLNMASPFPTTLVFS